jgi:hypothetical protein
MPLTNYSDLQTQVSNWLARADLSANIPDFVTLFEACANRRLRTRFQENATATLTPDAAGKAALPADYLAWRNVVWTGSKQQTLEYVGPSVLSGRFPSGSQGNPVAFTIEGNTLIVAPANSISLIFDYVAKVSALSGGSNWLMTNYPDAYLFGTLAEAYGFVGDAEKAAMWAARRDAVFDEIDRLDFATKLPSGVRTETVVV